jgi:hypothetical protein
VPGVDPPTFIRLKHFNLEICLNEFYIEDLVTIIQHAPALESLKLVHQVNDIITSFIFLDCFVLCKII